MTGDTGTGWLDDTQQRAWRSFLTANRLVLDRIDRQLQQDADLPHTYYEILVRLSEAPGGELRMSRLATSSLSSRSRISHAVARLEDAGLVRRIPCPTDRRGSLAELTEAGLERLRTAAPGHVETVRSSLFDPLSPAQLATLQEISDALVAHLAETPVWPATGDGPPAGG